jgi:3-oxoacyl-[acyl-carrier-protein] synthase II
MSGDGRVRVAITGIGVVSPLGIGRDEMWRSVVAGRSGAGPITLFDASDWPVRMACEARGFDPTDFIDRKAARRMDRYAQLSVAAARLAVEDSGLEIDDDGAGIGATIGNGGSGTISREEQFALMRERGVDRVSPFAIPLSVANMGAGQVSIELGLRGPVTAICTACAAGTDAIGTAADVIRRGDARAMLAGGGDSLISPFFVAGFDAMRVLSHRNDDPAGAARHFDAGLSPGDVDHVNAHGGASRLGDPTEIRMLRRVLGDEHATRVAVTSTKSMHGHCMGATGALEAAITALAVHESVLPPTINLTAVDPECAGVDHVAGASRPADVRVALSASYGLGGHNAVLALTRVEDGA